MPLLRICLIEVFWNGVIEESRVCMCLNEEKKGKKQRLLYSFIYTFLSVSPSLPGQTKSWYSMMALDFVNFEVTMYDAVAE